MNLKEYAKFGMALLGAALVTLNYALPLLPEQYKMWATLVLVFLTALGVRQVPNAVSAPRVSRAGQIER